MSGEKMLKCNKHALFRLKLISPFLIFTAVGVFHLFVVQDIKIITLETNRLVACIPEVLHLTAGWIMRPNNLVKQMLTYIELPQ